MNLKKYLLAAALIPAFAAQTQAAEVLSDRVPINDAALIWIGGRSRPDWNKELFTNYLIHTFPADHDRYPGKSSWFFDGFIFLEGGVNPKTDDPNDDESKVMISYGEMPAGLNNNGVTVWGANKQQYEELLDLQLGTDNGLGCRALDQAIEDLIPVLGRPATKHKVVLMQIIPTGNDTQWGELDGRRLNFALQADRIAAMKWYIDLILRKWDEAGFKNIELAGTYWLRESCDPNERPLAKAVNEYAHSKNLTTYWIPYFNVLDTESDRLNPKYPCYYDWKELGFDMTYIQPNYVFTWPEPTVQRLKDACDQAWDEHMDCGLEMEFEGKCIVGRDENRQLVTQGNACFYENEYRDKGPVFYHRFREYIETFENEDIFLYKPLAYYNGYQAVADFKASKNPMDQQLINRLASNIVERQVRTGWATPVSAGIRDVMADSDPQTAAGGDGCITVAPAVSGTVSIYSADGSELWTGEKTAGSPLKIESTSGIRIVSTTSGTAKVVVR